MPNRRNLVCRILTAAVCLTFLGWAGGAYAASTAQLRVLVDIQATVSVEVEAAAYEWPELEPGENISDDLTVRVRSNVPYSLTIAADRVNLTEFDTRTLTYVTGGRSLTNPLEWRFGTGSSYVPISTSPVMIRTGLATTSAGDTTLITFKQTLAYEDVPLTNPDYRYATAVRYAALPQL